MARNLGFVVEEKLTQAMEVFWSKGYNAASLTDLTSAMGLNKSSMYNSFGNKHTLFKEALKAYGRMVDHEYDLALQNKTTALAKIEGIIDYVVAISIKRKNSCLGVKTLFEVDNNDQEVCLLIKAGNDKTIELLKTLIEEAQTAGDIKPGRDAEVMASFIFNSFAGLRQSFIIYNNGNLVKKMGAELKLYIQN